QLAVDLEDAVLAAPEQQERLRAEGGHLPRELGADGAAGAGDEDDAAPEVVGDLVRLEADGLAPEEVLDVDLPDLVDRRLPAHDLVDAGDDPVGHLRLARQLDDPPD